MTILTRFRRIHCFFDYPTITVSFLSNKLFSNDTTSPCLLYIRYPKNAWSPYVSSNKSRHVLPSFIVHLGDSYQTSSVPLQMMNSLLFILYRGKFPLIVGTHWSGWGIVLIHAWWLMQYPPALFTPDVFEHVTMAHTLPLENHLSLGKFWQSSRGYYIQRSIEFRRTMPFNELTRTSDIVNNRFQPIMTHVNIHKGFTIQWILTKYHPKTAV